MPVSNAGWDEKDWPLTLGNLVVYTGSGAPTNTTLPANITFVVGNFYWDTSGLHLSICTTQGDFNTSVWRQLV